MLKTSLAALFFLATFASHAEPSKYLVVPENESWAYDDWHFSPAVRVGDTVWLSGKAGGGEDHAAVVRRLFTQIAATLEAAGADMTDVVEIVSYHRDMGQFQTFAAVHAEIFDKHYPAWTAVGVTGLVEPTLDVEIKVTAVVGSGASAERVKRVTR